MITSARSDEKFDYQVPAELFPGNSIRRKSRVLKYMRFEHAADAVRFAVEKLPADLLLGAYLAQRTFFCSSLTSSEFTFCWSDIMPHCPLDFRPHPISQFAV